MPNPASHSFFLWGSRKTGKSTLLKQTFPNAHTVDLLDSDAYLRYSLRPRTLTEELSAVDPQKLIIIDEVQKIPQLLDEVHWNIESRQRIFGLCGSSARKLRRGHSNLLGGRALRFELRGFSANELGSDFDLIKFLNSGYIPQHYLSTLAKHLLSSYVADYLRQEVAAEALVRNLPAFSRFLQVAALGPVGHPKPANLGQVKTSHGLVA